MESQTSGHYSILVGGATGYVGGLLARRLAETGYRVRCMARRPEAASELADAGCEVVRADVLEPETLVEAMDGIESAYYLIHSMGRGSDAADFAERDLLAARNFGSAAAAAGVKRIIYLGGLGQGESTHLKSRHDTASALAEAGVPLTYFRAAVVIGSGSESFRTVLHLAKRLPVMVTPKWVSTKTQPIAAASVIDYLAGALEVPASEGREIEIGGPDVTTYGGMLDAMARGLKRREPLKITVPFLTPWLSSLWIGLVTPVDPGVARPLIEGLSVETVVTDPSGMELFEVEPMGLDEAMRAALAE
jgi:uncharacterized protein YbjT (DUF2867 family)